MRRTSSLIVFMAFATLLLAACNGGGTSTVAGVPSTSAESRYVVAGKSRSTTLPTNLLYAGACLQHGPIYCTQYGISVFDAHAETEYPTPVYTITEGITTGPYAPEGWTPPVAVDDKGNLYVGTGNGTAYGSQPGEVLVYPPGQTVPSATLTGIPSAAAIATSAKGDVAVEATDGSAYTFPPGATTPQRTFICKNGKSPFTGPGGIGYSRNGTLFIGENYGTVYTNIGVIFRALPAAAKCPKKPLLSAAGAPNGLTAIAPSTFALEKRKLLFVGADTTQGSGAIEYFDKGSPDPINPLQPLQNSVDFRAGLARDSDYVYFADGDVWRQPASCLSDSGSGCSGNGFNFGIGLGYGIHTAAVYPRWPIRNW